MLIISMALVALAVIVAFQATLVGLNPWASNTPSRPKSIARAAAYVAQLESELGIGSETLVEAIARLETECEIPSVLAPDSGYTPDGGRA